MSADQVIFASLGVFGGCVWIAGPREFLKRIALVIGFFALGLAVTTAVITWWLIPTIDHKVTSWKNDVVGAVPHVEIPKVRLPELEVPDVDLPKVGGSHG